MNKKDLRFDIRTNATKIINMKITHEPTGLSVHASGVGRRMLQEALLSKLENKVNFVKHHSANH